MATVARLSHIGFNVPRELFERECEFWAQAIGLKWARGEAVACVRAPRLALTRLARCRGLRRPLPLRWARRLFPSPAAAGTANREGEGSPLFGELAIRDTSRRGR